MTYAGHAGSPCSAPMDPLTAPTRVAAALRERRCESLVRRYLWIYRRRRIHADIVEIAAETDERPTSGTVTMA
jgi:hypothetical protein